MAEAFANRALALGMSGSAAKALIESLETQYDAAVVRALSVLAHNDKSLLDRMAALAPLHPADADLQHTLGAWSKACGNAAEAINYWQRAIAQGGGAESWNQLGQTFAEQGQFEQAYIAENNARRVLNGESPLPMSGITLQQKIAAEAVSEQRNEHGIPWLPQ
jgi:HemY protein